MDIETFSSLPHQLGALTVDDIHTDLAVLKFVDRLFIIITQFQKVGSLISVSSGPPGVQESQPHYTTKVLFGKDEVQLHAFAQNVAEKIQCTTPLLLGTAFVSWPSGKGHQSLIAKLTELINETQNYFVSCNLILSSDLFFST